MTPPGRLLLVTSLLLVAAVGILPAQQLTLTPQLGLHLPTRDLEALALGGDTPRLRVGPALGASLGLWFGSRLGMNLTGSYVPTALEHDGTGTREAEDAELIIGSAQVVLFLLPPGAPVSAHVSGGMGLVGRGGVAFLNATDTSDLAGAFGAGVGLRVGGLSLQLGAELMSYTVRAVPGLGTADSSQLDLQLKLGLGIPVGAR